MIMTKKNYYDIKELAVETINEIWIRINWDEKNYIKISENFINNIKRSSMITSKYEIFVEKLCSKLQIKSLSLQKINEISNMDEETKYEILKLFREQPQIIFLEMRLKREREKEHKEHKEDKEENQDKEGDIIYEN
ncbi:hypothetical protein ERM45_00915 [Clostridioides difficile]|nr:hypothetical protein [Clostridioides difficile]